ncbi:putative membrane protein [Acinetobacter baumannii 45057_4]|nr:putative membrane protein [Acinetobacter baumannii 45057_4]
MISLIKNSSYGGTIAILVASFLWGTTGTAAAFAPTLGPLAIGAVAMGGGGLLQALIASRPSGNTDNLLGEIFLLFF